MVRHVSYPVLPDHLAEESRRNEPLKLTASSDPCLCTDARQRDRKIREWLIVHSSTRDKCPPTNRGEAVHTTNRQLSCLQVDVSLFQCYALSSVTY